MTCNDPGNMFHTIHIRFPDAAKVNIIPIKFLTQRTLNPFERALTFRHTEV